ncbi:DUF3800 domain-containing protein [Sporosarcina sp. G11-34]|uniref:DUF3800 domain-containing protein n=1 Tax=Sporosarcina sp. G11-34 TaxID=2849605 RepID=UPI0022A95631|nr:DUF3800 domain-containing protein [Sporosarcina sp. G11-34]MCZ2259426.1 DUF3800 domain-containing protein [Sporosarcina sp. G11-34]
MVRENAILDEIEQELISEIEGSLDQNESLDSDDEELEKQRQEKAQALWTDVQNGNDKHLITRVASILNRYPDTRNSDIALQIKYWQTYDGIVGNQITLKKLFEIERLTSIARSRAKIQNEYKLFRANEKIRRYRRDEEEIQKEIQLSNTPPAPIISIYVDETGKNDDYVIVGGVWVLKEEHNNNHLSKLINWVHERMEQDNTCPKEFHFSKIRNNGRDLAVYKDFFEFFIQNSEMASFKAIAVKSSMLNKPIDEIINDLFYQHVRLGIEHEIGTNRISFPQQVVYFKDSEAGESSLRIKEIEQSLTDSFKIQYESKLTLNYLQSVDSATSRMIQIADLYAGALNRKLNVQNQQQDIRNAKDEFADFIYDLLDVEVFHHSVEDISTVFNDVQNDMATIHVFE